jgi:predicted PhzF superfamily epimerase YddE/YHI9
MTEAPLVWVDAFTDRPFAGNPAAVCLLDGPVDDGWMQSLAGELGLSETAYVWPDGDALSLRWFTPVAEVDLCGHATLAAAHALAGAGRAADGDVLAFHTRSGVLTAEIRGDLVELDLPADPPAAVPVPEGLAGLGARSAARGRGDLAVELGDAQRVRDAVPDLGAVVALGVRALYVTATGDGDGADYVLRVFAPAVGIDEDPVTGSAQCLLGPYWADRLGRRSLQAVQLSRRGGRLAVSVDGDRVRVGGRAVTVLAGRVALP